MAKNNSDFEISGSNGRTALLHCGTGKKMDKGIVVERVVGEASFSQEFESSVPKRLVRSVSQKLKKKNPKGDGEDEGKEGRGGYGWKCLGLYAKGGRCRVGADTSEELGDGNGRRKSNVGEDCMGYHAIERTEEARVDCFSYGVGGVAERFWRWNSRKAKAIEQHPPSGEMQFSLPDDILEMCLARVSLTTLMNARLVCKKWRALTTTPHFMQMRCKGFHQSPWLFLFGAVKDGYCSGQIHALDVSLDRWHRLDADILRGRFMFSVVSVRSDIYVVGGCSSLANFGRVDKSSFKTHKGVLVFSPLTGLWRKAASMKSARSGPVLGVFEVDSCCSIFQSRQDRRPSKSRVGGVSDVYEDPYRFSLRRQLRDAFNETEDSSDCRRKPWKFDKKESKQSDAKDCRRFVLIVVGGQGYWDEPLDSGEIYDPISNKWMDIARLPGDFGVVCSGAVCNGIFYVYSETDKLAGYDIEKGIWIGIQTSPSPPRLHEYFPKLVSCSGRMFMICVSWCETNGQFSRREKAVRKIWELGLTSHTWNEVSKHPDAPMDWNAVFVADRGMIFGAEMFKIFGQVLDFLTVCNVSDSELKWKRISKKHVAHEVDASSCMTKTIAVLHL